jgi:aspartate aminotransferase
LHIGHSRGKIRSVSYFCSQPTTGLLGGLTKQMSISRLASTIKESPTLSLNEKARKLRELGHPVIHLGIGEPKNPAPINALLSSSAKLKAGDIKYVPTDGTPSLKKAIIRYTEENYDRLVAPENVIVSTGAKQAIFNILFSIINPQDEVIILAPHWVSYPEMVKMVYGIPVIVAPEDGTFIPRMQDIEEATTSYTKAIIVNSPNNPSGAVFPESFIADIVDFCERNEIYLIMDDIYQKLVFDKVVAPSAYKYTNQDIENSHVLVVNGVAKLYGMTGYRIGWAIAPKRMVEVMTNVQSNITSCPPVISQSAAEGALTGIQSVVDNLRLSIQNNRDVLMQEMRSFSDVITIKPLGTFYALPDFRAYTKDSVKLAQFLLEKAMVVTVPGLEFGMEGHLRLSYSGSVKDVIEGIERMKWALDPNAPNEIYIGDRKLIRDWL